MSLSDATREKIEHYLDQDRVVLFMKGSPRQPMCGFSAKTAGMLDSLLGEYTSVDVLADEEIREGIKVYGQWPTIPQLYIDKELVGGCDIVTGMFNNGELHEMLGLEKPDRTPPEIIITEAAAAKIAEAMADHDDVALHLQVDADWQTRFSLAPAQGGEIATQAGGLTVLLDLASAQRARGAKIDWVSTMQGEGLSIDLPGAPAPVPQMPVAELKDKLDAGAITLVDVRPMDEREKASIEGALGMDATVMSQLEAMPTDTPIAFICHTGVRSQAAAEHFRKLGFTAVANVAGGIHAWSVEIDPSIPTY
ncbi:Grx4 family monothiol glutaredoxin [Marinihelvus fidelis]|uniref:Grx4 family monothiol glutaredoxin n=1 Tax=Marinihelvus fidelis TaxID=2613842 RepID=A0A5N0T848_9GAMM|nr:Grx4 family monothiol glutaredoxin [Marinihelvus fidelis]KAA9130931.1 Grx4 family monothiol glutaredoxin [Marinihelvus fidelis]